MGAFLVVMIVETLRWHLTDEPVSRSVHADKSLVSPMVAERSAVGFQTILSHSSPVEELTVHLRQLRITGIRQPMNEGAVPAYNQTRAVAVASLLFPYNPYRLGSLRREAARPNLGILRPQVINRQKVVSANVRSNCLSLITTRFGQPWRTDSHLFVCGSSEKTLV